MDLLAHDRHRRAAVVGRSPADILPAFTDAMATLEPTLVETDHRALAAAALRMAPHRSLIVLLTGLDNGSAEDGLLARIPCWPSATRSSWRRSPTPVSTNSPPPGARWTTSTVPPPPSGPVPAGAAPPSA
ncbi:hypothetical protein GCM10025734_35180 [Kitasatospora paranensis]